MLIRLDQLNQHLKKGLLPYYLLSSDEALLLQETRDAIVTQAYQSEFKERQLIIADTHFDWSFFINEMQTNSLFSERRILDVRFNTSPKLTTNEQKMLAACAKVNNPDCLTLISLPKVDNLASHPIHKLFTDHCIAITIWPLDKYQYIQWLKVKLQSAQLKMSQAAFNLLTEYCENNLLAAMQAIHKLQLLHSQQTLIEPEHLQACIIDQARFTIFNLTDSILQSDGKRIIHILNELQETGTEAIFVLWSLARDIRLLSQLKQANSQEQLNKLWQKERIPEKKRGLYQHYSKQVIKNNHWPLMFSMLKHIDAILKGQVKGNLWDTLTQCALNLASYHLPLASTFHD